MKIQIVRNKGILKQSPPIQLPKFTVITGENGAGKSQLLKYFSFPVEEPIILTYNDNDLLMERFYSVQEGFGIPQYSDHVEYFTELHRKWEKLRHLGYIHSLFLHHKPYTSSTVYKLNEKLSLLSEAISGTATRFGYTHHDTYSGEDFETIDNLLTITGKHADMLTFEDFFAFRHIPNLDLFSSMLIVIFKQFLVKMTLYPNLVADQEAPWDLFNKLLDRVEINYKIDRPLFDYSEKLDPIKLTHKLTGEIVGLDDLSSGEKTILSLVIILYNTSDMIVFPDVLLLDEPDAYLHPVLAEKFIHVVQDIIVKERGISVIMTTHSATTVALVPPESVFLMNREKGYPVKQDINEAIRTLTRGLTTLNVSHEHRKQIFTEAGNDEFFYQKTFEKLVERGLLSKNQLLLFVSSGGSNVDQSTDISPEMEKAGCDRVKSLANQLYNNGAGNRNIFGIIDFDMSNHGNERIIVFGGQTRYCIENFIYDPMFLACFALQTNSQKKSSFGLSEFDDIHGVFDFESSKLQLIVDTITEKIFTNMIWKPTNTKCIDTVEVKLISGATIVLPKWYLETGGHQIEKACRTTYPALNKMRTTIEFISTIVLPNYKFLPIQVVETFQDLQSRSIH